MSALKTNIVSLPEKPKVGIAPVPRMRSRDNLFNPRSLPANHGIVKKCFVPFRIVVLQTDVDCQTFREQNLSRYAVHIPGIPSLGQSSLGLLIFRRFCWSRFKPRSGAGFRRRSLLSMRLLAQSHWREPQTKTNYSGTHDWPHKQERSQKFLHNRCETTGTISPRVCTLPCRQIGQREEAQSMKLLVKNPVGVEKVTAISR